MPSRLAIKSEIESYDMANKIVVASQLKKTFEEYA